MCGLQLNGPSKEAKIVGGFTANQGLPKNIDINFVLNY